MTHANHHLVAGTAPLIGRVFEAEAVHAPAVAAPHSPRVRPAPALPFVGALCADQAGRGITVTRRLAVGEDLFLADHNFVHAPGIKPLHDCFPVLPLTAGLELMAETAACLAPGYGLLGFEAVTARRWIAVTGPDGVEVTIRGRLVESGEDGLVRVLVEVFTDAGAQAAAEATVLFGTHYPDAPAAPLKCRLGTASTLDPAQLYGERHLFHGPRFQGLHGAVCAGPDGASATLRLLSAHGWFASAPQPQLLCDPAALDTVGQLLAVWSMQQGAAAFPVGLARLDLYGPTPAANALVPVNLTITGRQFRMIHADVEIGDGRGGTWIRITGWRSWQFAWERQLVDFQRAPASSMLATPLTMPQAVGAHLVGVACVRLSARSLGGFDLALLARHYLCRTEMDQFDAKSGMPQRQRQWLLGRIAAKDAARSWSARNGGDSLNLHPAAFSIRNDVAGQPCIECWPYGQAPHIGIAHSGDEAVALAGDGPVGIDIEPIAARGERFVAAFASAHEQRQLASLEGAERDAWTTRLWCAKEAFGKRLGTGVAGAARDYEAHSLTSNELVGLCHRPSGARARVLTLIDGGFIIAIDGGTMAAEAGETP